MKWLILLFTIQAAFAKDHCQRVPDIAKQLELQLMSKRMAGCSEISPATLNAASPNPIENLSAGQIELGSKSQCDTLSTVQTKIDALENRLIVLDGFETLKNDIADSKDATSSASQTEAKEAAAKFTQNLEIARSFDLLINSKTATESQSFLEAISLVKETDRDTPEKLKEQIQKICPKDTELVVCKSDFTKESVNEINGLIKEPVNETKIKEWKSALSIKKLDQEGTPWSFAEMYDELGPSISGIGNSSQINPAIVKKIKEMPDFANAPTGLKFIDEMKITKDSKILNKELSKQGFTGIVSSTQFRQESQLKGKVSYLWIEYNDKQDLIKDEAVKAACVAAYLDYNSAVTCVDGLKDIAKGIQAGERQTTLQNMLSSMESSIAYNSDLKSLQEKCNKNSSECVNEFTMDKKLLTDELLILKKIQEKILAENAELKLWRNYAFEATDSQQCLQKNSIDVAGCSEELAKNISSEAFSLTVDAIKLTTTMVKDSEASKENILALCDAKEEVTEIQKDLCAVAKGENVNKADPKTYAPDVKYKAVTDPGNDYNPTKTAVAQGLSNLLGAASKMFLNPVSSYPRYNYMNPGAMKPLSISDNIISSARSQSGYGVYSAVTPSMSRYFTK